MSFLAAGFVGATRRDDHGRAVAVVYHHRVAGPVEIRPGAFSIPALHDLGIPLPDAFDLGYDPADRRKSQEHRSGPSSDRPGA